MLGHLGLEEIDDLQIKLHIFYLCKLVSSWGYKIKDFGVTVNMEGYGDDVHKIYNDLLEIICGKVDDTNLDVDDIIETDKIKRKLKSRDIICIPTFVIENKDIIKYLTFCKRNKYKDTFLYHRVNKLCTKLVDTYCMEDGYFKSLLNTAYNIEIYYTDLFELEDGFFIEVHNIIQYCKQKNRLLEMI